MDAAPLPPEMTAPAPLPEPSAAAPAHDPAPAALKAARGPHPGRPRGGGPGGAAGARAHAVEVPADAPRLHGVVVSRQEKFGFVKAQETEARYFFHVRDTDGVASHGAQVTFVVARDRTAGKDVAYDVVTVAERPRSGAPAAAAPPGLGAKGREERLPGLFSGVVAAVPRGPPAVRIDDGMIVFTDGVGMQQQALFGACRLAPGAPPPGLAETVEFGLVRNAATGVFKATGVRLANAAALAAALASAHAALAGLAVAAPAAAAAPTAALPPPSGRQLGRVALLKKEFGFIRQVARPGDLFFHFSQLEGISPGEIRAGDDVEFSVSRDRDGKLSAAAVRRAAPGAVVFDAVGAETIEGVVLEKPLVTKQYVQSSGVLEYDLPACEADGAGAEGGPLKRRIVFAAGDCVGGSASLRPGDHVTFRVATNIAAAAAAAAAAVPGAAQLAGRRAVEVAPVVCAGKVASVYTDRKFGFIVCPVAATAAAGGAAEPAGAGADGDAPLAAAEGAPADGAGAAPEEPASEAAPAAEEKAADGAAAPAAAPAASPAAQEEEGKKDEPSLATASSASSSAAATEASDASASAGKPHAASAAAAKPRRVFFHFSEVAGGVALRLGDEVAFVLHSNLKNGELNASRVHRTKAAPESPPRPARAPAEAPAPAANPNKLRLTGNLASGEHKTQYQPSMPDGSPGFGLDRSRGLEAAAAAAPEGRPFVFFAGLPLKGVGKAFAAALSVEARPFIPRAESLTQLNLAGAT